MDYSSNSFNTNNNNINNINNNNNNNILGTLDKRKLQKRATLGTADILRKALMQTYKTFIMGNNITCTAYCNHRIAATVYTL